MFGSAVGAQRSEEHFSPRTSSFLWGGAADGWGGQNLLQGASVRKLISKPVWYICETVVALLQHFREKQKNNQLTINYLLMVY